MDDNGQYKVSLDQLSALCKRRGFIFQTSEIYGGLNGFWDYGPLGVELKRNIRSEWWRAIVQSREDVVGLDSAIIMHPSVWEASGHVGGFADAMVDCRECKRRFKADTLCEEQDSELIVAQSSFRLPEGIKCPVCGAQDFTEPKAFNLMFKTSVGPVEDASSRVYLRPETAQGIFTQFPNVLATTRQKLPFGIAQIGKAFRNEVNPRNYTFRSREFEQMEMEYFVRPGKDEKWHEYWVDERMKWYETIGLSRDNLHLDVHPEEKLAHYASACTDIAYDFPFGLQELEGIAARGDYDLSQHQELSGKSMEYFDESDSERFLPHVIEPSAGVDRVALALLCEAYCEEWIEKKGNDVLIADPNAKRPPEGYERRVVMRFAPSIAPVKVGVFPLLKNKPALVECAREVYRQLSRRWPAFYDQNSAIGRRYRRQDEIGTPFGVTIDFDTLEDNTVTVRERDSMQQTRLNIEDLEAYLAKQI